MGFLLSYPPSFVSPGMSIEAGRLGQFRLSGSNKGKQKWWIKVLNSVLKFYPSCMLACNFYQLTHFQSTVTVVNEGDVRIWSYFWLSSKQQFPV